MKLLTNIRDFVLPGTFGEGRRAYLTGIVATIYQLVIYVFVIASIYNSFMLYIRFGRINSFLTIYSELNGIEAPSIIYCKERTQFNEDSNIFNGVVLTRILHHNHYYYSDNRNLRICNYEGTSCLCIDSWKQSYYKLTNPRNDSKVDQDNIKDDTVTNKHSNFASLNNISSRIDLNEISRFPPGKFPIPYFIKHELEYRINPTISLSDDFKYKPHLINWCGLNLVEYDISEKKYINYWYNKSKKGHLKSNSSIRGDFKNVESHKNIYCEYKDTVEFLFISENRMEGGTIGFYTSKQEAISAPMWVKTSFPGLIFAYLQLEKNWIIDFYLLKYFMYHRMNPIYHLYKYLSRIFEKNVYTENSFVNNQSEEVKSNENLQNRQKAYLVTEVQQIVADIAQIHGKVLPNNWSQWLLLHHQLLNTNNFTNIDEDINVGENIFESNSLNSTISRSTNSTNFTEIFEQIQNNYSTLWVRAEYQIFVTPNTVRVANKHFLLKTFGLIMSIIFSLNYLNLFYSVFPFYRGEVPKLTVSPLMKFLSCNLLNSYHEE